MNQEKQNIQLTFHFQILSTALLITHEHDTPRICVIYQSMRIVMPHLYCIDANDHFPSRNCIKAKKRFLKLTVLHFFVV
jgi:hypothetical protein